MYLMFIATIYATFCGFDKIELTYLSSPIDYLSNDTQYHMNICGSIHNSVCKTTSLLCKISNQSVINLVDSFSSPLWSYINSSVPMIGIQSLYNNGDICLVNQTYRVNIQYLCNNITNKYFEIEKIDNCSYVVRQKIICNAQSIGITTSFLREYIVIYIIFLVIALPFIFGAFIQKYQQYKNMNHINWYGAIQECKYNIKQLFRSEKKYKEVVSEESIKENLNPNEN